MRAFLLALILAACAAPPTSTTEQGLCTLDDPGCVTAWSLGGETRARYGSPAGRVSCSPISSTPGMNYASCTVTVGVFILFSCTFGYNVSPDGETEIQSVNCH